MLQLIRRFIVSFTKGNKPKACGFSKERKIEYKSPKLEAGLQLKKQPKYPQSEENLSGFGFSFDLPLFRGEPNSHPDNL